MSKNCYCRFCGRPTDCGGDICELCEAEHPNEIKQCSDGHCDLIIKEVKDSVFLCQNENDGSFYLKKVEKTGVERSSEQD